MNDGPDDLLGRYLARLFGWTEPTSSLFYINPRPDPQPKQPDQELSRLIQDVSNNRNRPEE